MVCRVARMFIFYTKCNKVCEAQGGKQKRPSANRWQVEVARVEVLTKVRTRNHRGSVESYHVSCQSRVWAVRRSRLRARYAATARADSNREA